MKLYWRYYNHHQIAQYNLEMWARTHAVQRGVDRMTGRHVVLSSREQTVSTFIGTGAQVETDLRYRYLRG